MEKKSCHATGLMLSVPSPPSQATAALPPPPPRDACENVNASQRFFERIQNRFQVSNGIGGGGGGAAGIKAVVA